MLLCADRIWRLTSGVVMFASDIQAGLLDDFLCCMDKMWITTWMGCLYTGLLMHKFRDDWDAGRRLLSTCELKGWSSTDKKQAGVLKDLRMLFDCVSYIGT